MWNTKRVLSVTGNSEEKETNFSKGWLKKGDQFPTIGNFQMLQLHSV